MSNKNRRQENNSAITIPELPKGKKLQIIVDSNWGDSQSLGINKIQFFSEDGNKVYPI